MSTRARLALSAAMAAAALADNVTTWFAVSAGAVELNPIVSVFLSSPLLFALFTAVKVFIFFVVVYSAYTKSLLFYAVYTAVLIVFVRASVINTLVYLQLAGWGK